jgi:Pyridoxamine 5'-phosphate oxidase
VRRTRGHIPWSKVDRRLHAAREIWLATAAAAAPDAVPVWFWWDGECVYFSTKADSRKARKLQRAPGIVVHNGDGADPIILKGTAEQVTDERELARGRRGLSREIRRPWQRRPGDDLRRGRRRLPRPSASRHDVGVRDLREPNGLVP